MNNTEKAVMQQTLDVFLESREFYELMQAYRHYQVDASRPFELVKSALRAAIAQPATPVQAEPLTVAQYSRCSDTLRNLGKSYPRTCAECGLGPCKTKPAQSVQPDEQAAFETWLADKCPSGDVSDVQRQWEASSAYADIAQPAAVGAVEQDVKEALVDLLTQVESFCTRYGEGDFETAKAYVALTAIASKEVKL